MGRAARWIIAKLRHFKIAGSQRGEGWVDDVIIPAGVVRAGDIHVRPIVRDEQPIFLHRAKDFLHVRVAGTLGDVHACFEPQTSTHREGARGGAGGMGGRIDMALCGADCHTKRMLYFRHRRVIINFIVSDQPRQDRQTRGVGGGPPFGPAIVGVHVEERTRAAVPSSLRWVVVDIVQFVEIIALGIDDD